MIPSIALRALDVLGINARVRLVEGTQYTSLLRKHNHHRLSLRLPFNPKTRLD